MKYRNLLSAFLFIFLGISLSVQAEYRVFVLKISRKPATAQTLPPVVPLDPTSNSNPNSDSIADSNSATNQASDFRLVESTLDPEQYRYFYPVKADEEVTYIDTWRCYGRTDGFKPLCSNPKGQNPVTPQPAT